MKRFRDFLTESEWWHGSPSSELKGGTTGIHLGTRKAAEQALHSRIGIPVHGTWDGTREYGKTLLKGQKSLGEYEVTGHNCKAPEHDYYPHEHPEKPKYSNGESVSPNAKPSIKAYKIVGKMTNHLHSPHSDTRANAMMMGSIKKGNAKRGYYYKNDGEDAGSISAVVPHKDHLQEIK